MKIHALIFHSSTSMAALLCGSMALANPSGVSPAGPSDRTRPSATRAKITASSEVGRLRGKDHTARAAFDGKKGEGYWCTAFDSKPPHWLVIGFAAPTEFDQIILHLQEQAALQGCRIDRWDGKEWIRVAEMPTVQRPTARTTRQWEFGDGPTGVVRARFPTVTSDRIRLWFDKDRSIRLFEVEALKTRDTVEPAPPRLDGSAPLIRVAFGLTGGPPRDGWLAVSAKDQYSRERGIGWIGPGDRVDCDRYGGAPIGRHFVAGWGGPGRLRLDLPAGRYVAAAVSSDFVLPVRPFSIGCAGASPMRPIATICRGAWDVRRFRIEAAADGTELTLDGDVAWLLNALLIAPESNLDALLAESNHLEEQLALGSPEWMDKRTLVPVSAPEDPVASEAERARGCIIFPAEPTDGICPSTRPSPHRSAPSLASHATPGEIAVLTMGVLPLMPLFNMRLAGCELAGPDGAIIPLSAMDIRIVRCWPQIDKTPAGRGRVAIVPELIERQDRHPVLCAAKGMTRQYWITVGIPKAAKPGAYRGRLRFSADHVPTTELPMQVTVLPFQLHTPAQKTFFVYSILDDFSDQEIIPLLRDMRDHGMNSLVSDLVGGWQRIPGQPPTFDAGPVRRILRLAKAEGFNGPMPWHASSPIGGIDAPQGSESWNSTLGQMLRQIADVREDVGGQEVLFYPVDEPFGVEERLTLAERAMAVARKTRLLRTYCTPASKDIDRLGALLDVRCYAIGSVTNVSAAASSSRDANAAFWWYTNAARELPDVRRYLAGCWFWSTGADGQGYWVYQSRWRRGRPFQDLEGDLHAHDYVAYPDVDGVTPTLQWECIRMGIDDARYLYTLEAAISSKPDSPEAHDARRFLDDLRGDMPPSVELPDKSSILYQCPWTPADFTRLRAEITKHILNLRR